MADGDSDNDVAPTATATSTSTIASRIEAGLYSSLAQLQQDVAHVCASIVEPIKAKERQRVGARLPPDDIKTIQHVTTFQHQARGLLTRESNRDDTPKSKVNGVKSEPASDDKSVIDHQARTILTLFGNAPTPRQLFSSFQHPSNDTAASLKTDRADISLEELGLPNMLNATKVMPLDPVAALGTRPREPTFATVFPASSTLPQLNPPKAKSNTRSASIHWLAGDSLLPKPSRKNAYTTQPLNVGSWIDYGGRDADRESSGAIKRRRRESVVSTAPSAKAFEDMTPAEIVAQEEALFKAAYSSFAPTVDNSKAIISDDIRSRVWWHKLGQRRFDKRFLLDPALDSSFPPAINGDETAIEDDEEPESQVTLGGTDELKEFQDAVDNFDEEAFKAEHLVTTIKDDTYSVDETLLEISHLLETLSSYQRIRNSYLAPTPSRNPTSPAPALAASLGTPTGPTKDELSTYKALRAQLARLISSLPPYAVAKLDGEQLEDLAVSKTIIIKGNEFKGSMEEDQLTRMIRSTTALQAAAGPASVVRPSTEYKSTSSSYGRATSSSMAQPPRSAHAPNPSYYGGGARTPATNYIRSTAPQNYATPSATAQRPSYGQSQGYQNTANRQPSYSQGQSQGQSQVNGQQQGYRASYGYGNTQGAQATPQPPPVQTPGTYSTQQTGYRNSTAFNQNTALGTPSYPSQSPAQSRQVYGTAAASQFMQQQQQRPNSQPQQPTTQQQQQQQQQPQPQPQPQSQQSNTGRSATPSNGLNPQTPSALGPSGFHTSMTSEQQQMMMERQRAQLAQQPLARMQAQADMQRVSATPQPPAQQQPPPPPPPPPPPQQQPNGDVNRGASATPVVT